MTKYDQIPGQIHYFQLLKPMKMIQMWVNMPGGAKRCGMAEVDFEKLLSLEAELGYKAAVVFTNEEQRKNWLFEADKLPPSLLRTGPSGAIYRLFIIKHLEEFGSAMRFV